MVGIRFAGYDALAVKAPDDPLWLKWRGLNMASPMPARSISSKAELAEFNVYINNAVTYTAEPKGEDHWQSPAETWRRRTGDCEDVAILKYAVLKDSGIPEQALWLVVGEIRSIAGNRPHAWLGVDYGEWCVLDVMFGHVIRPADYVNWTPFVALHGGEMIHYGKTFRISDVMNGTGV